jgi:hypothetical protein
VSSIFSISSKKKRVCRNSELSSKANKKGQQQEEEEEVGKEEEEKSSGDGQGTSLKRITWQSENCLSCKWFFPADPLNADIMSNGKCMEPSLKKFELIVTGRDWCNKFEEISQTQIERMQEKAMGK